MNLFSLENLQSIEPIEFENLVKDLLIKMGFHAVTTKASGDGGIDILATNEQPILSGKYIIQCKRYTTGNNIGEPTIRELFGVMHAENANKGILVTTSDFSKQAIIFAQDKAIELINGKELIKLFAKYFTEIDDKYIATDISNNISIGEFDNSFLGIEWGSKIAELTGFVCIYEAEDENIKHYRRLNDKNTFGGAAIERPYYYFNSNRFWSVMMRFNQWKNFEIILNYLINTLGKPSEEPEGITIEYKWAGKNVDIALRYYPNEAGTGVVELNNMTIFRKLLNKKQYKPIATQESKQCFIATVIYESKWAFQVMELQKWRDSYLSKGWFGQQFIKLYYKIGPYIAEYVEDKRLLKKILKRGLDMVVVLVRKNKHTERGDDAKEVN